MQNNYSNTYRKHFTDLTASHGEKKAIELIVGGQYETIGVLESSLLITLGLQASHTVVDVGCGSGRLAWALREYLKGRYIGFDILPELISYADKAACRKDWEFLMIADDKIPLEDNLSDYVCFFSVFTHILDEDIFRYLEEAKRVIKPGGSIVFTFLDFSVDWHWPVFLSALNDRRPDRVLTRFLSKDTIRIFCSKLSLKILQLYDGPSEWIKLTQPITYEDGRTVSGVTCFGQSVAVITK